MGDWWQSIPKECADYGGRLVGALLILLVGWIAMRLVVGPLRRLLDRSRLDPSVGSFLINSVRTAHSRCRAVGGAPAVRHGDDLPSNAARHGWPSGGPVAARLAGQLRLRVAALGLPHRAHRRFHRGWRRARPGLRDAALPRRFGDTGQSAHYRAEHAADEWPVRNNTYLPSRRVQWTLPVSGTEDLAALKASLRARLQAEPRIHKEPAPQIYVQDWAADKRTLIVTAWTATADYLAVQQEMLEEIGNSLEAIRSRTE